jgi:hypothetical protein
MISPWIISTAILSLITAVSFYYTFKFARIILRVEDAVEISLDTLDENYSALNEILETPLFYNSPEIKKALGTMTGARNAVLLVANSLVSVDSRVKEIEVANVGEQEIGN